MAGVLALLLSGAAMTAPAQTPPTPKTPGHHQHNMKNLALLPGGAHHVQAMAYRDTLATAARAFRTQVRGATTVDLASARPAVALMRLHFGQIQEHHQAQMAMMGDDQAKPPRIQHMETRLAELDEHLKALEAEVNTMTPDPKKLSKHASEILKQCAGLSAMPVNAKPRVAKGKP